MKLDAPAAMRRASGEETKTKNLTTRDNWRALAIGYNRGSRRT